MVGRLGDDYMLPNDPFTISSDESNYYSNPTVKVTPEQIEKVKCGNKCVLIIDIMSTERLG